MSGYILEYVENGFSTIEVQKDTKAPHIDSRELLSIWEFETAEERDQIIQDLRRFRQEQRKGKA
jgi:hypothetical protein